MEIYFTVTESQGKYEKIKIARVFNLIGPDILRSYNTFKITPKTAQEVLADFEECCILRKT